MECDTLSGSSAVGEFQRKGTVQEYNNGLARILLSSASACGACSVVGSCASAAPSSRGLVVEVPCDRPLHVGQQVTLLQAKNLDILAVIVAFLVPVALMGGVLILGYHFLWPEALTALLSLGIFSLYLLALFALRKTFNRKFKLQIVSAE